MNILKTLVFAASAIALASTARAVEPVAVFAGESLKDGGAVGTYTLSANGNIENSNGTITIANTATKGVEIALASDNSFGQKVSVLVKYSGFDFQSTLANSPTVVSACQGKTGNLAEYADVGVYVTSTKFSGFHTNTGDYGPQTYNASDAGYILFEYDVTSNNGNGVIAYVGAKDGEVWTWSGRIGSSGLKFTGDDRFITSVAVGGPKSSTGHPALKGLTIEGIAVYKGMISTADAQAYTFPVPPIVFSNINCGADSSGGVGDYNPSSLTIPTSCGLPEGTELKIKSIAFAQETGKAWNYSADYITLNGIQSDIRNNNSQTLTAWSIGNKLEYKFSTDVIVKVGTQYPMTAILGGATTTKTAYPLRVRLFKTTAEEYGYIQLHTGMDLWRPAYEIVAEKVEPPASIPVPAVILSDAKLWLDASDENNFEFDANNKVTKWIDRSSSHHDATPASTSPNNVTNYGTREQVDGRWVYQMGNVSSGIDMSFTRITDIRTVFWVMDIKQDAKAFFLGDVGNSCYDFHRGNNGAYAAQPRPFNQAKLISCDGVAKQSDDIVPTGMHLYATILNSNASANRLSQDRTEGGRNGGRALSELIIFNRELTTEEMQEVSAYLSQKWLPTRMFSDPLATAGEKVPAGTYGEIVVPTTGIKATAYSSVTAITPTTGSIDGLIGKPNWTYLFTSTVSGWFKINALPTGADATIYGYTRSGGSCSMRVAVTPNGKLKIGKGKGNNVDTWDSGDRRGSVTTGVDVPINQWFYLTVAGQRKPEQNTGDSKMALTVFINGVQEFAQEDCFLNDGDNGSSNTFVIGAGVSAAGLYGDTTAVTDATIIKSWATNEMIVEMVSAGPSKATATISENTDWSDIQWDDNVEPTAAMSVELTFDDSYTLTLDDAAVGRKFLIKGIDAANQIIKIAGSAANVAAFISKATLDSSFTGKIEYEFDCSTANFTADNALKNTIKSANANTKFIFKGSGNFGAALGYGFTVNAAIHSHIVFDGGTHTMSYGYGDSGTDGNCFGVNATGANPTVLVTGNATLNFTAKDISYWSGVSDIGGVIRVNDGATLNLLQNGSDTFFYRQRLWLDPGSLTTFNFSAKDQGAGTESCFRWQGGAVQNKEQIYVPASTTDQTSKPAVIRQLGAGSLHLASDATRGLAIFVGENSKLRMETPITAGANDATIIKYGTGVFETTSSIAVHPFTVTEGTFASSSTINKLTIGQDVAFDISEGAPTVTESFTAQSKVLKLTIAEPEHMMSVITLPAAADKTGWTAVVNGNTANPCELVADGNTLKLKWKIPPTIEVGADDVVIEPADDWNGGVVKVDIGGLNVGDYEGDIRYLLRFGGKVVEGSAQDASASFNLDPSYFTAGNIYRGTFELEYGTGNEPIVAAEVTVYAGEKTYSTKEGWINEHPEPLVFRSTGVYNPEGGASVEGGSIVFANPTDVIFTPTNSPADYVAKCDSEVTFEIFSGEEAIPDDDDTVADDLQAGVKIVDGGNGTPKFQFISGDEWIDGPAATLNTTYAVTVNFHYAKDETDSDSVTYTVKDLTQEPVVANRRANTAEKLETISFADGTQIASLTGTCQIEVADPVEKGMAPGADEKELKATDETAAQAEAEKIPVLVPSEVEGGLTEGLDDAAAAKAKADYKVFFKVVAQKNASGKFVAVVVPTVDAEKKAEDEAQKVSEDVLAEVTALTGDQTEGTASFENAVPGFFYGVAENGEVVEMKTAEPEEWKMAGASGKVELKVTKPANAKARFYKVICSPLPKK